MQHFPELSCEQQQYACLPWGFRVRPTPKQYFTRQHRIHKRKAFTLQSTQRVYKILKRNPDYTFFFAAAIFSLLATSPSITTLVLYLHLNPRYYTGTSWNFL